ncbi:MAG: hypothetical protein ABW034_08015 [Steroidobacteraceae bacterium]
MTTLAQESPLEQRPTTPFWSENFALVFNDPVSRTSALYSIGTWYLDTSVWRENLTLTLPDGRVVVARNFGRNTRGNVVSAGLSRYEIVEPDHTVKWTFDGPVWPHTLQELMTTGFSNGKTSRLNLVLTFEATHPMWDMHAGHNTDSTGIAGAMHIEQIGRANGSITVDGKEIPVRDAYACRDHSRGGREISKFRNHCWINGAFPSGRAFQSYYFRMYGVEGAALSLATVVHEQKFYPATIEQVEVLGGPNDAGKSHVLRLKSELGEMKIDVDVLATNALHMTAPFNPSAGRGRGSHAFMFDEAIRVKCNGEVGLGWCERGTALEPLQ